MIAGFGGGEHGDDEGGDLHGHWGNRGAAGGAEPARAGTGAAGHPLHRYLRQRPALLPRHLAAVAHHGRGPRDLRHRRRAGGRGHRLRGRGHGGGGVLFPLRELPVLHHRPVQPLPAAPGGVPQHPRRLRRIHRRARLGVVQAAGGHELRGRGTGGAAGGVVAGTGAGRGRLPRPGSDHRRRHDRPVRAGGGAGGSACARR